MDSKGVGYFYLDVEIPNTNPEARRQSYEVGNLTIDSTVLPEVMVYSMVGTNLSGTIELSVVRINGKLQVTYNKKVNVTYGCSAGTFQNALNQFDGFKNYRISV